MATIGRQACRWAPPMGRARADRCIGSGRAWPPRGAGRVPPAGGVISADGRWPMCAAQRTERTSMGSPARRAPQILGPVSTGGAILRCGRSAGHTAGEPVGAATRVVAPASSAVNSTRLNCERGSTRLNAAQRGSTFRSSRVIVRPHGAGGGGGSRRNPTAAAPERAGHAGTVRPSVVPEWDGPREAGRW